MSHLYFNEESGYSVENKTCYKEVFRSTIHHHRRKLNIFTLQLSIYYIQYNRKSRLVEMDTLQKTKREKQIVLVVERWIQCLLLRLKPQCGREASQHPPFMDICSTISHT